MATSKANLFAKIQQLGVADNVNRVICNWMDSAELEDFVGFLEEEL